ncbi:hypothetical protein BDV95DRAFT_588867 [Massariosphaeria phaeospora]|uniref:RRM domain-containing protein n=1 Tax=Massariosphaeria phaeospora TaxID=100035 RepID=A0A7C8MV91_9PLEO|nr:hypothetical protein BDV95DRAFT_588867 [Massariosphaeria phaeospora]
MAANLQPHPSLPARPPPATYSAGSARNHNVGGRGSGGNPAFGGHVAGPVVAHAPPQMSASANVYSQPHASASYQPTTIAYYNNNNNNNNNNNSYGTYGTSSVAPTISYGTPALTSRGPGGNLDPEEEARIAEWTSAYTKDDPNPKKGGHYGTTNASARTETTTTDDAETTTPTNGQQQTVIRAAGGRSWEDPSLLEWDPMHPRIFVGNLAGEVTDDSLLKAFAKFPSVVKARVVRDKRTTKSKSYGFVSFSSTDDFFRAAKEMNGKYIGSHPVLIKRANSEVKATTKRDDKHGKNHRNNKNKNKNKNKCDTIPEDSAPPVIHPGAVPFRASGVHKKGKSSGPRVLG